MLVLALLVVIFAFTACATPPTPRHAYASYVANWNDLMESYRIHYAAQLPMDQLEWDRTINPILLATKKALNAWGQNPTSYDKEQAFLVLKREAERVLFSYGLKEVQK